MFKFKKILALLLLTGMMFDCCKTISKTEEKNNYMYNNINELEDIEDNEKYIIKYDKKLNLKYIIFKDSTLSRDEQIKIIKENSDNTSQYFISKHSVTGTVCAIICTIATVITLGIVVYQTFFQNTVQQRRKLNAVKNGWVSIEDKGRTLWFYKEGGYKKKGWYYDDYYGAWYYFLDNGVMFDPKYSPSSWIRVSNKWYDFSNGGALKKLSCWKKNGDKWLYHIPGDYGAIAGSYFIDKDGKLYEFDENGYWK